MILYTGGWEKDSSLQSFFFFFAPLCNHFNGSLAAKNGESIILARRERKWNVSFQTGPRLDATLLHRCLQWRRKNFRILTQESSVEPTFHFCNIKRQYLNVSLSNIYYYMIDFRLHSKKSLNYKLNNLNCRLILKWIFYRISKFWNFPLSYFQYHVSYEERYFYYLIFILKIYIWHL